MFNMGSGFGNTGACRRSYSCLTQREKRRMQSELYIYTYLFLKHRNKIYQPVAEEAILDDFDDERCCIFFTQTWVESLPRCEETRFLTTTATSIEGSNHLIHISMKCKNILTHLSNLMVCPLKQGRPVSSMSVTKETTASM